MTSAITRVAACERDAERNREEAEAVWRAAWWRTTIELARPARQSPEVTAVLDDAVRVLGQSRSYLSDRRSTGMAFKGFPIDLIQALPPRLTMAWTAGNRDRTPTRSDISDIHDAEDDGVSLRDFAARYGQRFEKPVPESVPNELTPEQVVEAARSNPDVVAALAADKETREAVEDAGIRQRADARPPSDLATPEGRADAKENVRRNIGQMLGDTSDEATNYLVGAAHELGHALFARERWGITNPDAEADAVAAIDRLMAIYKADIAGSTLTTEDKQFLESIGITASA